ncbi:MAG TPA: hypothetical protein VKT27_08815 [Candidatus Binataceae bacterium]|nr:hypothetical protein [Candidatus Binataceae bacterium]
MINRRCWQLLDSILAPVGGGIAGAIFVGLPAWTAWKNREQLKTGYHQLTT